MAWLSGTKKTLAALTELGARQDAIAAELRELSNSMQTLTQGGEGGLTGEVQRLASLVQRFSNDSREKLAMEVVEAVGHKGFFETSLYRAFVGFEEPHISPPSPVPFTSSLCHQAHFLYDQYRYWCKAIKEAPHFVRKQWEWIYITQVLYERGMLKPGNRGMVFGAGLEPLPSLFASFGCEVVATDQSAETAVEGGWSLSDQHTYDLTALNDRGICTDFMFRKLVSFQAVDMNAIPAEYDESFDFCWSSCCFEHLGSLQHGLDFVRNSLNTLKPGGIAVHTTEFNVSSNDETLESPHLSIYRRRDIEPFMAQLVAEGFEVSPIDWNMGEGFAETVVDLPPFVRGEPHIRLKIGEYDCTSIGLIIRKPEA